jgi:hypothetical protein
VEGRQPGKPATDQRDVEKLSKKPVSEGESINLPVFN